MAAAIHQYLITQTKREQKLRMAESKPHIRTDSEENFVAGEGELMSLLCDHSSPRSFMPGPVEQLVAILIADPGVMSLILAWPHTLLFYSHSRPSPDSRRTVVSYKRKYAQLLVSKLVKTLLNELR